MYILGEDAKNESGDSGTPSSTKDSKGGKSTSKSTKAAKAAKGKDKASKKDVAKANGKDKGKKAVSKPAKDKAPVERDQFGFRKGSKKSLAAALYSGKKGATLAEVKEKTGSSQLNLLTELKGRKVKIETTKEKGAGKKQVTRYKIIVPEGGIKAAKPAPKEDTKPAKGKDKPSKKADAKPAKKANKKTGGAEATA